jgi:hypothetical protein
MSDALATMDARRSSTGDRNGFLNHALGAKDRKE